jgi:hypothetical protein
MSVLFLLLLFLFLILYREAVSNIPHFLTHSDKVGWTIEGSCFLVPSLHDAMNGTYFIVLHQKE